MKYIKYFSIPLSNYIFLIFKILGPKLSSNISGKIFEYIGPLFRSKKIIIANIKAFPDIEYKFKKNDKTNVEQLWKNFAEYIFIKDFRNGKLESNIKIIGQDILGNKKIIAK